MTRGVTLAFSRAKGPPHATRRVAATFACACALGACAHPAPRPLGALSSSPAARSAAAAPFAIPPDPSDAAVLAQLPADAGDLVVRAATTNGSTDVPPAALGATPLLGDEAPSRYPAFNGVMEGAVRSTRAGRHGRPYHAGPRIIIDVSNPNDAGVATDLQRTVRNLGYWTVRRCYEIGLRRDQRLAGKVTIELTVGTNGVAASVAPAGTTLGDPVVAACVAREVALLSFAAATAETTASAEVSLSPGDAPVSVPAAIPDAERVRQALRTSWTDAAECLAQELQTHRHAGGRIEMHFRVSAVGDVADLVEAQEAGDPHVGADMARCVLAVYRNAKLPPAAGTPGERTFVYALEFESGPAGNAP